MRLPALALFVLCALAPRLAAQAPAPCEIRGHLTVPDVHVVGAHGTSVVTIEDRDVRVTPLGHGFFALRTHGGTRIEGRTQSPVPIALAAEHTYENVARIAAGTRVEEIVPRGGAFTASFAVHEGVSLRRVVVQCRELAATEPTDAALDSVAIPRGPAWHARVWRLRVHSAARDDAAYVLAELTPDARARVAWIERERREGWARVEAALAHAHVAGWVHDTDLALPR